MCDCSDSITNGPAPVAASSLTTLGNTLSNINASNLAFGIVSSSLIYGNTLSNINASNVVGLVVVTSGNNLSNINASNIAFGIVSASLIYGNTLSNINASNITGLVVTSGNTLSNINASNLAFGIVSSSLIYGNTLSNINASNITQPFANLVVTNSVTTTNIFATRANVVNQNVSSNLTVFGALTSNAANTTLFYDTLTIPYINTLTMNSAAVTTGTLVATGATSFGNIIVSNLQVTNTFIITATNVQSTNALSIINQGTTTALYVNQNEFPNMTYNVAEFWDHTQLAMVIDGNGNVAVHTASSPEYAFTVNDGAKLDTLAVTGGAYILGNTGIGTTNPGYLLDVSGDMRTVGIVDSTSSSGSPGQFLRRTGSGLLWTSSGNTLSDIQSSNITQPFANLTVQNTFSAVSDSFTSVFTGILGIQISGGTTLTWIIDSGAGQLYSFDGTNLSPPSVDTGLLQVAALADDINYYTINGLSELWYGLPSSGTQVAGVFNFVFVDKISGRVWAIDSHGIGYVDSTFNFVVLFIPTFSSTPVQIATWGTDQMYILDSVQDLYDSNGNHLMSRILQVTADSYGNYYTIDVSGNIAINGVSLDLLNNITQYQSVTTQNGRVVFLDIGGQVIYYYTPVSVSANNLNTNSIIGLRAEFQNLTLSSNAIALGSNAMLAPGNYDVAIGAEAMKFAKSSNGYSVAIGANALLQDRGAGYNTAVGANALSVTTLGNYNTSIGYESGTLGQFSNTVSIGAFSNAGADNVATFGPAMSVGIGTNIPVSALQVVGTVTATAFSGDGSALTNISGGSVVGTVGTAQSVTVANQSNITSVGTLTGLTSSGTITAPFFVGGGNTLSNLNASNLSFGTIGNGLLPSAISVSNVTANGAGLSSMSASNLTFGTVANARLPTAISVSNVTANGAGLSSLNAANLFGTMTTANIGTLNVTSISVSGSTPTPGYVLSTTGTGLAWIAGGGGGSSQWSGTAGNPIYYAPFVGIGSSATPTANLMVTGNIYASNAIQTTNIVASGFTSNSTNTNFSYDTLTVPYLNVTSTMSISGLSVAGQISAIGNTISTSYGVCPPLTARQGVGVNWNPTGGTQSNFLLSSGVISMQAGSNTMAASPTTITFPIAYVNIPIVLITPYATTTTNPWVSAVTATNFQVTWTNFGAFEWLSIGS